ncbi:hypothetical protein K469DRAFT_720734 [Zopfia rhizophila CBS 207.26]|uniref:Peptidase S9 prolyl oligopeptidase catalytic domain-containing protein n=1 Tax=Zopfia rhizophila CBS 207.26 TaxID=1314779 RepID=A0A6A6DD49_9PEZI|nr:hypothetical protein K469DRAFT_720734 [Zopfia rhizophila CBS 207.26]
MQTNGAVRIDLDRIMTAGDSAGGYLSLMLGLSHPEAIRAVTASYPMVDVKSRHYQEANGKPMFGRPYFPRRVVDEHLSKLRKGEAPAIISADPTLERVQLMFCFYQNGLCREFFPVEKRELFPLDRLDDGTRFPHGGMFVWHGKGDTVVPTEGSMRLKEKVEEVDPELNFCLAIEEGDHGFDADAKIDDKWMADGLKDLVTARLA